ncbi:MAG: site-specific DNA-methyltransferase [Bacteroidetes bacterium]|nr:site-specific DNA-methyltransferase [Bacteroidota bacterium]
MSLNNDTLNGNHGLVKIINDDVLRTELINPKSIDLIITSPPYNVEIEYNSSLDNGDYSSYLNWTEQWLTRCFRWLKSSGRMCLNIPLDKNKGGQQSVGADITTIAKSIGYGYHSTIVWNEGNISRRTAWGSWLSASAPYVIAPVEIIVVMYKDQWKKSTAGTSDILREEFIEWTNGVWTFNGQTKKGAGGHPAAFPVELPKRCIKLFSYVGDTVLDPFLGSGSTLIATKQFGRCGIGIEIDEGYCKVALQRTNDHKLSQLDLTF